MELISPYYPQLQILAYVALAMVLGAVLGLEREIAHKPAGLRTHMMLSGAATLLVALGEMLVAHFEAESGQSTVRSDPLRIIEAVITGVSFLGAGTIIRHSSTDQVEGLTTAASLLFAAAVGVTVAVGQVVLAAGITILALLTLRGVQVTARWFERR
ncbi:MAG TPA: MgtC/SapB family protein [Candidatus Tectomicrobia bacterium]|nr:MgtC/SapB family protein [Candidatus Tectomicrobia bacterium]